ncbi:MAG: efflux RND transporter periplasmic adaptor subunit [Pseudomonadota bacterium]
MNRKIAIASAAAVVLVCAGTLSFLTGQQSAESAAAPEGARQGPPPAIVTTAAAVQTQLAPQSETPGSVVSKRDSLVAAATAGKIEWVAEVGAEVNEGDVIARLEVNDAQFVRDDAAAQVRMLRARANYQNALYERFAGLGEDAGESEASMDEMRSRRDEARQSLAQAQVALERAQVNLQRTTVTAPFAGRVVSQESQVGEFATAGTELVRLVDTVGLEVTARAPASLVRNISVGGQIPVVNGQENALGVVRAIIPVGDELSRLLELRVELPDTTWFIGSPVRLMLPTAAERNVIAVPRDALVLRADRISVFLADNDNTAKRVDVTLGIADGDLIEVIGNVKDGDQVIIRGGERLRDGQSVTISSSITDDISV